MSGSSGAHGAAARRRPFRALFTCGGRAALAAIALIAGTAAAGEYSGTIVDANTGLPVAGARVTLDGRVGATGPDGRFAVSGDGGLIGIRAPGYARQWLPAARQSDASPPVALVPFRPKALYLSFYGIGSDTLRQSALDLVAATELNALVIDIKGDRGGIAYPSAIALAHEAGAQATLTIRDLEGLLASLHEKGIYTIARIVTFKDHPLAMSRPDLAVRTKGGAVWRDREGLAWTDPFRQEVRDYNIAVAVEAARGGFDEIQFDYIRFPDAPGLVFSGPNTEHDRRAAVAAFLREAGAQLAPYNVFLAADIFGYVCWNDNDMGIGQKLEELEPLVDYISPMLYPSCYHRGIPGIANPVQHPYDIVYRSLQRARERTQVSALRFRPWLQAFRDYAFDRRPFTGREIREQIRAAEEFGSGGWMLWNPRNVYTGDGLDKE